MSRNVHNWRHANFNNCDKVFLCPSHKLCLDFWQEIRRIKVIKCPPNSSLQGDINGNPNPNLKDKLNTNSNPKVTTRWLTLILDLGDTL